MTLSKLCLYNNENYIDAYILTKIVTTKVWLSVYLLRIHALNTKPIIMKRCISIQMLSKVWQIT